MEKEKTLKITIKTLSPTLFGTGATDGLIDSDTLMDEYGFPYINPRRVKGLLREYSIEVLEICGIDDRKRDEIINHVFGSPQNNEMGFNAKVEVGSFVASGREEYSMLSSGGKKALPEKDIINYFTKIIHQTRIDYGTQTATDKSLRRIRVVRENVKFNGEIKCGNDDLTFSLISLAVLHGSMAGTKRNRGLGEIKLCQDENVQTNIEEHTKQIRAGIQPRKAETSPVKIDKAEMPENFNSIKLEIVLENNIILAQKTANKNEVSTEKYISGRKIWGVLANKYLETREPDEVFYQLFLSGKLQFNAGLIKGEHKVFHPVPFCFQESKNEANKAVLLFDGDDSEDEPETELEDTKPKKGFCILDGSQIKIREVKTIGVNPHHSRAADRIAGKSRDGELFYYEALKAGQKFEANITGDMGLVKELVMSFPKEGEYCIGLSKFTEYGGITMKMSPVNTNYSGRANELDFFFVTPCIVYNENCFAEPSITNLVGYLNKILGTTLKRDDLDAIAGFETQQHYNTQWRGKTTLETSFAAGSSFRVKLGREVNISQLLKEGIGEHTYLGFGQIRLMNYQVPEKFSDDKWSPSVRGMEFSDLPEESILRKILDAKNRDLKINILRKRGATDAQLAHKGRPLENSQISNLRMIFKNAENYNYVDGFRIKVKEKKGGRFFEDFLGMNLSFAFGRDTTLADLEGGEFTIACHYFISVLDTFRILNKLNEKNKKDGTEKI